MWSIVLSIQVKISSEQIYPRVLNSGTITESKLILNSLVGDDFDSGVVAGC